LLDRGGDIHKSAPVGNLEPEIFSERFHQALMVSKTAIKREA
jgi:hypothetical protein